MLSRLLYVVITERQDMENAIFPLVIGVVLIAGGTVGVLTRNGASRAITAAQLRTFPFLRKTLEKKRDARGVLAAGIFAIALGALMLITSLIAFAKH